MGAEEVERAEERLRVLATAMRTFAEATTNLAHLLDVVARNLAEVLGDSCVLLILSEDGERLAPVGAHAVDPEALARVHALVKTDPFLLQTHPVARRVLETRTPILVPHVDQGTFRGATTNAFIAFQQEQGIHSLLAVALHAHGKPIGLLTLTRYRKTSLPFDEHDLELVSNVADHASLAIVNARLYVAERTARLAAEAAVRSQREAEARFAKLSEVGLLGIVVSRIDATIIDVNPYVETLLGYSREALVSGKVAWASLTPPDWDHVDERARQQIQTTGIAGLREKELVRADGKRVPVLLGSAYVSEGPELITFLLDLSERKRAEATLARLRAERVVDARFRVLVEAAPDAIVVTNGRGEITLVNAQTERLLGYARTELAEAPIERLIPDRGRVDHPAELTGRRKDGTEFPLEITESRLETEEGVLAVTAIRDITQRKQAERALFRAKETAESASRDLESFSYSVAHDLRSPLRTMNGFAQILLEDHGPRLDGDAQELLQGIVRGATKMGALIDGLLGLSRLNREPNRQAIDLTAIVRAALEQALSDPAEGAHPPTEVVVADGLVVEADPTLLQAMIDNLVGNAVKFTRRTAAPRIELGVCDREGESVLFLRDNGAGFDLGSAKKLFAPFQRFHRAEDFPGTGIGLATVRRIIARHGGRIWAESAVGAGATFYFTLPAATATSDRPRS